MVIFIFRLLCELFEYRKYKEMNCNFVCGFFTLYFEVQIMGIWNNHEYGVLMNYKHKCV
jgi:hypothetical protein